MAFPFRFFHAKPLARWAPTVGMAVVLASPYGGTAQAPVAVPAVPNAGAAGSLVPVGSRTAPAAPSITPQSPTSAPATPAAALPTTTTPATTPTTSPVTIPAVPAAAPATGETTQGVMQIADLLESLARFDRDGRTAEQKIGFELPERAINEYLAYSLRNRPRPGISAVTVTLLPKNDIAVAVEVDFASVTQWNPEILPEPLRPLLSGKRSVQMNAHFESKNGAFTLTLKDVHGPDGKLLENALVTTLLRAIGARQPEAYDPSKPIPLPFGLKRVWTEKQSVMGET